MPNPPIRRRRKQPPETCDELPGMTQEQVIEHRDVRTAARELKTEHSLTKLLDALHITRWDFLLIGDGSATRWITAGGWASVLIARTGHRKEFYGGVSCLTNVTAELMAYVHPLMYLSSHLPTKKVYHIHIITDCEHLPYSAEHPHSRNKNIELWTMVDAFKRRGLVLKWHWIPRDTVDLNQFSHNMANLARKAVLALNPLAALEPLGKTNIQQLSAWSPPRSESPQN